MISLARKWQQSSLVLPPTEQTDGAWKHLQTWLLVAFALRAAIALSGDFVIHPDEIMQYLEPAHRAVFGNGIVFWEYQYGGRSWLVPGLVAGILWLLDKLGMGVPWIYVYIVKVFFCVISLLIPWGAYHFARRAFSEDAARMALILACLWPYLVVLAHKPYTEFISTALLFGALGLACRPAGETKKGAFLLGAMLTLAFAIRLYYLPLAIVAWLYMNANAGRQRLLASLTGVVAVVILVACVETLTWGSPFHSYQANLILNFHLDDVRTTQEWYFYLPRLLYTTAGGALIMLYAFCTQIRRQLFLLTLVALTLVFHMASGHKEFRFVFVLLPICLVVVGVQMAEWSKRWPSVASTRTAFEISAALLLVTLSNVIDDRWLYEANSHERGDARYLFGQGNMFDVYLELAKIEDVSGVLHVGDPYFNTPGYYYLHHDVPLYDVNSFKKAMEVTQDHQVLFTHVVSVGGMLDLPDVILLGGEGEEYTYGFLDDPGQVRKWKSHTPYTTNEGATEVLSKTVGYTEPSIFEFAE